MNLNDLIRITDGYYTNLPKKNRKINRIKIDSREITTDDVFICINSGTKYVMDAINKGAVCIISEEIINVKCKIAIIKVNSIKDTLISLATYIRNKHIHIPIVAVTGSNGKTTVKELIYHILSSNYKVLKSIENNNNYIGVCKTIFNLDKSYDVAVIEMGMNHAHEIEVLSNIVKPDIGIITNIGTSHIGLLGSKKDIFLAKIEIFAGMGKDSYLIVPSNDKYLNKLKQENVLKCYDIMPKYIRIKDKLRFDLCYDYNEYHIHFNIPNKTYIDDIILAFKACTLFEMKEEEIINRINDYEGIEGRMKIIDKGTYKVIDDTYNCSYESLIGSLDYLKKQDNEKMIILGDILELGDYSKQIHKKINRYIKKIKNKEVLLVGDNTKYIKGMHFKTNKDMINYLNKRDLSNFIVLVKGSHKMNMNEIKDQLIS